MVRENTGRGARGIALDILCRIDTSGGFVDLLFDDLIERRGLKRLDYVFIKELVYGVLRVRGDIDWRIERFSHRNIKRFSPRVRNILRLGVYQLLFMKKVPPFAAVNESVRLVSSYGEKRLRNFVNALLRKVAEGGYDAGYPSIQDNPIRYISTKYSHPPWMVKRWIERFGIEKTLSLCKENNSIPPITIRTNAILTTRERIVSVLKDKVRGLDYCYISQVGLIVRPYTSIRDIPSYKEGWFYVQDEGSQIVSCLLDPKPGERILDICAAPGGKITHIAELMKNQGEIIGLDINRARISILRENIKRLRIDIIKTYQEDATLAIIDQGIKRFDRILVDAPCSGLGILRRHPEGKWQKEESLIRWYQTIQFRILDRASSLLKKGGIIVYSTCSGEREENEDVIDRFLLRHPEFSIEGIRSFLPVEGGELVDERGFLSTINNRWRMDNIFAARLTKHP